MLVEGPGAKLPHRTGLLIDYLPRIIVTGCRQHVCRPGQWRNSDGTQACIWRSKQGIPVVPGRYDATGRASTPAIERHEQMNRNQSTRSMSSLRKAGLVIFAATLFVAGCKSSVIQPPSSGIPTPPSGGTPPSSSGSSGGGSQSGGEQSGGQQGGGSSGGGSQGGGQQGGGQQGGGQQGGGQQGGGSSGGAQGGGSSSGGASPSGSSSGGDGQSGGCLLYTSPSPRD